MVCRRLNNCTGEDEGQKLKLLHDDFDVPNWKHGNPMIGTMTFTDVMPVAPIESVRDIYAEIDNLKARVKKLEKR